MEEERDVDEVGWLDRKVAIPRGELLAFLSLALSWRFDGAWGGFFLLAFFGLALWMLLGS